MSERDRKEGAAELLEHARTLPDEEALTVYAQVLLLDPDFPSAHYNVGLIHKYRREWNESFRYNKRAVSLRPDDEASNWNLAIAATALRDWRTAREVWHRLGMAIDPGDGPVQADFGVAPVRLNPDSSGEVVWARRICPVRARIQNIPYPKSGFRFGDVVLHDGAPTGSREWEGREYPVFNVLELFEASDWSTYVAEVQVSNDPDAAELTAFLDAAGIHHEDWTESVRTLCKQCSEGRVHEQHDHDLRKEWQDRHVFGLAARDRSSEEVFMKWSNEKRWLISLEHRLSPPVRH
jgi:hypothetical protein